MADERARRTRHQRGNVELKCRSQQKGGYALNTQWKTNPPQTHTRKPAARQEKMLRDWIADTPAVRLLYVTPEGLQTEQVGPGRARLSLQNKALWVPEPELSWLNLEPRGDASWTSRLNYQRNDSWL